MLELSKSMDRLHVSVNTNTILLNAQAYRNGLNSSNIKALDDNVKKLDKKIKDNKKEVDSRLEKVEKKTDDAKKKADKAIKKLAELKEVVNDLK